MSDPARTHVSDRTAARRWMGKLLMAVIFGLAIWNLITSLMANVIGPALGSVLGPDANLPASFTRNYDYPDLFLAIIQFCIAAIVAIAINWFMQRGSHTSMSATPMSVSTNLSTPQPSILPPLPAAPPAAVEPIGQSSKDELRPMPNIPSASSPGWKKVETAWPEPVPNQIRGETERISTSEPLTVDPVQPTSPRQPVSAQQFQAGGRPNPVTVGPVAVASALKPTVKPAFQDVLRNPAPVATPPPTTAPTVVRSAQAPPETPNSVQTVSSPAPAIQPAVSMPKKEKKVYYNIVGEPIEMDD